MGRILTIAHLTFIEACRRKIVPAALLCSVLFLLVYGTALYFINRNIPASPQRQFQLQFFVLAGLYVANFLAIAAAVLLPVDTLSGEIDSGVMQTLASKPIRRAEIVLGKWLTYWLMTGSYLVIIAGGVVVVARLTTGFAQQHLMLALPLMLLGATFMLTISITGRARLKTVTNGIVAFGFYGIAFIGGWIEQIGAFTRNDASRYVGTALSLASPSDALWRRAAYELQPPVMRGLQLTPFGAGRVPSDAMIWWAAAITALALLVAIRVIRRRAL
jgi:ABC-type transport system involved in multi-copper enzyme maturation permease subunit